MADSVKRIPDGMDCAIPYLAVRGASDAIEFYKNALGAVEVYRLHGPGGSIMHAEITIGKAHIMLSEENLEWNNKSPQTLGGSPVTTFLYFEDVDAVAAQVEKAGGKFSMPVQDMFWGDRAGNFEDPYGHFWMIASHIEDVSHEEIARRAADMFKQGSQPC